MRRAARHSLLWSIAWRFLRGRRSRLLSGTTRSALLATALGVLAMTVGMALMTGYREDLQERLVRGNAAVVVYPIVPLEAVDRGQRLEALRRIEGVRAVRRVAYGQGALAAPDGAGGVEVTLRGVDDVAALADLGGLEWRNARRSLSAEPGAAVPLVVGRELFEELGGGEGPLRLMVVGFEEGRPRFHYRSAEIVALFRSGFSEFDRSWVVLDLGVVETLSGAATATGVWEIAVDEPSRAAGIGDGVRRLLGDDFLVTDWFELNRELFTALRLQQILLFFVLGLIVLVSTFNIASSLVVLVRERMRDLGVLAALGLPPRGHRTIFLLYGLAVAAAGIVLGAVAGVGVATLFTELELIRFDPEVAAIYFISSVPFRVRWLDLAAIAGFTLAVTLLASWVPARRAERIEPAAALRYE